MQDSTSRCKVCGAALRHPKFSHVRSYNDPKANPSGPLVYMIEVMTAGRRMTKIGYTAGMLKERVRTIQTSTPGKIVVRGWIYGDRSVEAMIHELAHERWTHAHGEWFDPGVKPGEFDILLSARAVGCRHELDSCWEIVGTEEINTDCARHRLAMDADNEHVNNNPSWPDTAARA